MSGLVLATWDMEADRPAEALVLPDGCRDLIYCREAGGRPRWFVSDLSSRPYEVAVAAGTVMRGYRLRPGVQLDEAALLAAVQGREWGDAAIHAHLVDHGRLEVAVAEALSCLASGVDGVAVAAGVLGVGPRSLQRLLLGATGQSPVAWLQLARARRAARGVAAADSLAELADMHGYADQAHMTRAFRRWFGTTPQRLRRDFRMLGVLAAAGYG